MNRLNSPQYNPSQECRMFAIEKSIHFGSRPSFLTTFLGYTSLWKTPARWTRTSPVARCSLTDFENNRSQLETSRDKDCGNDGSLVIPLEFVPVLQTFPTILQYRRCTIPPMNLRFSIPKTLNHDSRWK